MWSVDQQLHTPGSLLGSQVHGPRTGPTELGSLGWGPEICVTRFPGDFLKVSFIETDFIYSTIGPPDSSLIFEIQAYITQETKGRDRSPRGIPFGADHLLALQIPL